MKRTGFNLTRWLPIPILICAGIVVYDYHFNPTGWYDPALFFLPLTIIMTVLLMRRLPEVTLSVPQPVIWQPFTRRQIALTVAGVGCYFVVAQVQGIAPALLPFLFGMHHAHQFAIWVIGTGLIIWGMAGGLPIRQGWQGFRHWIQEGDARWILLFMLVGLIMRTIALENAIHYYVDETNFASAVYRLRVQPNAQIMNNIGPVANFTWIYSYFQYYFTELFGATLANLRAVSVIIGVLTIPPVYLLGRWGFGRRVGLLAAFLLTIYLPHIHLSRLAMNNIMDPLLGVMAIALFWRGMQTGSRRMMALGGVFLGLTGYFYEGGRLLYPALIIGWLILYTLIHNGKLSKRPIVTFFASTLLIASGFYLSLSVWGFQNVAPRFLQQRVTEYFWTEFFTAEDGFNQVMRYFDQRLNPPYLHIMSQPDGSGFYYSREVGLVLPHMLPFMLIGLGVALFHWRRLGLILPLWMILTVLGNSLIVWNDWTPRFVVLFPALVLLMALGLDALYRTVIQYWLRRERAQHLLRIGVMTLFAMMGLLYMGYYFGVMLPDYNIAIRAEIDDQDAGHRAQFLSPETRAFVFPINNKYHLDVRAVQLYERHENFVRVVASDEFDFQLLDPDPKIEYAFFIVPTDIETLHKLKTIFGERLIGPSWSPYNIPRSHEFAMYQVKK